MASSARDGGGMRAEAESLSQELGEVESSSNGMSAAPVDVAASRSSSVAEVTQPDVDGRGWPKRVTREAVYRRSLAAADGLAAATALLCSIGIAGNGHAGFATLATAPLIVIISKVMGTYDREDLLLHSSTLDEASALFQVATLYALAAWLLDGLFVTGALGRRELLVLLLALFLLLLLFRVAARVLLRFLMAPERCLVIADQTTCDRIRVKFARCRPLHAAVVGCIVSDRPDQRGQGVSTSPDTEDLETLVSHLAVDRIIIAPVGTDEDGVANIVHAATSLGRKVSVLPSVLGFLGSVHVDDVEGVPLLSTRPFGLPRSSRWIKRMLDLVVSILALLVLLPFLAFIAIAIKLDTRGPVLFRQRRVGRDGDAFEMLKFRTMVCDAEDQKHELHELNESDGLFKIARDPRITRVGSFLRRFSLDEVPQLLHVLRGEMSLVGPRPLIAEEDSQIEGWRRRRLDLTPGMTGHWQVLGSARIPLEEMARIDYVYVTNWSLWLDLKILLRTVPYVVTGRGL